MPEPFDPVDVSQYESDTAPDYIDLDKFNTPLPVGDHRNSRHFPGSGTFHFRKELPRTGMRLMSGHWVPAQDGAPVRAWLKQYSKATLAQPGARYAGSPDRETAALTAMSGSGSVDEGLIPRLLHRGADDQYEYVIISHVEGTIWAALPPGRADTIEVFHPLVISALDRVVDCADHGVIHGDLHRGNLVFVQSDNGVIRAGLIDFDTSKTDDGVDRPQKRVGNGPNSLALPTLDHDARGFAKNLIEIIDGPYLNEKYERQRSVFPADLPVRFPQFGRPFFKVLNAVGFDESIPIEGPEELRDWVRLLLPAPGETVGATIRRVRHELMDHADEDPAAATALHWLVEWVEMDDPADPLAYLQAAMVKVTAHYREAHPGRLNLKAEAAHWVLKAAMTPGADGAFGTDLKDVRWLLKVLDSELRKAARPQDLRALAALPGGFKSPSGPVPWWRRWQKHRFLSDRWIRRFVSESELPDGRKIQSVRLQFENEPTLVFKLFAQDGHLRWDPAIPAVSTSKTVRLKNRHHLWRLMTGSVIDDSLPVAFLQMITAVRAPILRSFTVPPPAPPSPNGASSAGSRPGQAVVRARRSLRRRPRQSPVEQVRSEAKRPGSRRRVPRLALNRAALTRKAMPVGFVVVTLGTFLVVDPVARGDQVEILFGAAERPLVMTGPGVQFQDPAGIDAGPDGVLVSDSGNHLVRQFEPFTPGQRAVSVAVAGDGTPGFRGDGGPAVDARLHSPAHAVAGPDGAVIIADTGNHRVRAVVGDKIWTIAGNGTNADAGDGGDPLDASFQTVWRVGFDGTYVYVLDSEADKVRRFRYVDPSERSDEPMSPIATVANGDIKDFDVTQGAPGDPGVLFLGSLAGVERVDQQGGSAWVVGNGKRDGDDVPDREQATSGHVGVEIVSVINAADGTFMVQDSGSRRPRLVLDGIIYDLTARDSDGDLVNLSNVYRDIGTHNGSIYLLTNLLATWDKVEVVDPDYKHIWWAGGDADSIPEDRAASAPMSETVVDGPMSPVWLGDGSFLVVDSWNRRILRARPSTGNVSVFADLLEYGTRPVAMDAVMINNEPAALISVGSRLVWATVHGHGIVGGQPDSGDTSAEPVHVSQATFGTINDLKILPSGEVLLSDAGNHQIRKIGLDNWVIPYLGTGSYGDSGTRSAGPFEFSYPSGIAIDPAGRVVIADTSNGVIRRYDPKSAIMEVVAGGGHEPLEAGNSDRRSSLKISIGYPRHVAVGTDGTILVLTDSFSLARAPMLARIYPDRKQIQWVAGSRWPGSGVSDRADRIEFSTPSGLAITGAGQVVITDFLNDRVVQIDKVGVNPQPAESSQARPVWLPDE